MRTLIMLLMAAFVILALLVSLAHADQLVAIDLGFGLVGETSLGKVIFVSVVAGVLFTGLVAVIEGLALRLERRGLRRRLRRLEEELHDLRNLALREREDGDRPAPAGPRAVPASESDET